MKILNSIVAIILAIITIYFTSIYLWQSRDFWFLTPVLIGLSIGGAAAIIIKQTEK